MNLLQPEKLYSEAEPKKKPSTPYGETSKVIVKYRDKCNRCEPSTILRKTREVIERLQLRLVSLRVEEEGARRRLEEAIREIRELRGRLPG